MSFRNLILVFCLFVMDFASWGQVYSVRVRNTGETIKALPQTFPPWEAAAITGRLGSRGETRPRGSRGETFALYSTADGPRKFLLSSQSVNEGRFFSEAIFFDTILVGDTNGPTVEVTMSNVLAFSTTVETNQTQQGKTTEFKRKLVFVRETKVVFNGVVTIMADLNSQLSKTNRP